MSHVEYETQSMHGASVFVFVLLEGILNFL